MTKFLAHVVQDKSLQWREHDLYEHLIEVSLLAEQFAQEFNSGEWAHLAGLWHDLGKFSSSFQNYIKYASGYDSEAHMEEGKGRVDHSTAGALLAIKKFCKKGKILAYLIAGHHAGLPDWLPDKQSGALSIRLQNKELLEHALKECASSTFLEFPLPQFKFKTNAIALWIRMLFSCLVDADFLDTEKFMKVERAVLRNCYPSLDELKKASMHTLR